MMPHRERHRTARVGWLRAGVLGTRLAACISPGTWGIEWEQGKLQASVVLDVDHGSASKFIYFRPGR